MKVESLRRMNFTEDNLHWYENRANQSPSTPKTRVSGMDQLLTPVYSPSEVQNSHIEAPLPLPFAPWTVGPPSPAASSDKGSISGASSMSPTKKTASQRLSIESVTQVRPASGHSHRSSVVLLPSTGTALQPRHSVIDVSFSPCASTHTSRRGTPVLERTCITCKTSKPPSGFTDRRITANCWHEPATCLECLQSWIYTSLETQDSRRCTCPECGESMNQEDIVAYTYDPTILR